MPATVIQIVQEHCRRAGLPTPADAFADRGNAQIVGLLEEGCEQLTGRGVWQEMTRTNTWSTTATQLQVDLGALKDSQGLEWIRFDTLWDTTDRLPLLTLSDTEWRAIQTLQFAGPRYQINIRNNGLYSYPAPPAGHVWVFDYATKYFALTNGSSLTPSDTLTTNNDTIVFPRKVLLADLRWRWKKEQGLDYAEDYDKAERVIADAMARNVPKRVLDSSGCEKDAVPRIFYNPFSNIS